MLSTVWRRYDMVNSNCERKSETKETLRYGQKRSSESRCRPTATRLNPRSKRPDWEGSNSEPQKADEDGRFRPGRTTEHVRLVSLIDYWHQQPGKKRHRNRILGDDPVRVMRDQGVLFCRAEVQACHFIWRLVVVSSIIIGRARARRKPGLTVTEKFVPSMILLHKTSVRNSYP